jgi:hypothetical protein
MIGEGPRSDTRSPSAGQFAPEQAQCFAKLGPAPLRRPTTALLPTWLSIGPLGRPDEAHELAFCWGPFIKRKKLYAKDFGTADDLAALLPQLVARQTSANSF